MITIFLAAMALAQDPESHSVEYTPDVGSVPWWHLQFESKFGAEFGPYSTVSDGGQAGIVIDLRTYDELGWYRDRWPKAVAEIDDQVATRRRMVAVNDIGYDMLSSTFDRSLLNVQSVYESSLADLRERNRRTFMEKNGFAVGMTVGIVGVVIISAVVLVTYGDIIRVSFD